MKKSFYIWLVIILLSLGVLLEAYSLFFTSAPMYEYLMNIITIIVYSVLLAKLFKLHKDVVRWIHIVFGWTVIGMIYNIIMTISDQGSAKAILITNVIFWGIFLAIWISFVRHIKKLPIYNK